MSKGRGFLGWMLGILTGTALGILFAPRKGKETRERISKARKYGGLGHEPVIEDLKGLGEEIGKAAKGAYKNSELPDMIRAWRKKLHDLSGEFIDDIGDFHEDKVIPLRLEMKSKTRQAKHEAERAFRRVKTGASIMKRAAGQLRQTFKKK